MTTTAAPLTLTLEANVNPDLVFMKREICDPERLEMILRDTQRFPRKTLYALSQYKKNRRHGNESQVIYEYGKGAAQFQLGRLYARHNLGLQSFPFDIRNPLLEKFYWDCDMENCHYYLMARVGQQWGVRTTHIEHYLTNREAELARVSSNRRRAKTAFIAAGYGGDITLHNEHYVTDGEPEGDTTFLRQLRAEVAVLAEMCWTRHPQFHKLPMVAKKPNPKYSLFAYILQTEERKCLLAFDTYLNSVGRSMDVFIHDGGCVRKLPDEREFPAELLRGAEDYIRTHVGYTVRLAVKPMRHDFVAPGGIDETELLPPSVLITDLFAANEFIRHMGDDILISDGQVFCFDAATGIWSNEETVLDVQIARHDRHLTFRKVDELKTYGASAKLSSALKSKLPSALVVADKSIHGFLEAGRDRAVESLLFKNGVYDFKTRTLLPFDRQRVFSDAVPFDFDPNYDPVAREFVEQSLFRAPFAEGSVLPALYLHFLMRGMIGDYRMKRMLQCIGDNNCSKGTMASFMTYAFGGVVGNFDANNLLLRKGTEPSRDNTFLIPLASKRLVFSSEVKTGTEIDGEKIKSMVSGGDVMKGRMLYKNDQEFVFRALPIMMCNDSPPISNAGSVATRLVPVQYDHAFFDQPSMPHHKIADPDIKSKLQTPACANAMFHMLADEYARWVANGRKEPVLPASVLQQRDEICPRDDIRPYLLEEFDLTGNPEDMVMTSDLKNYFANSRSPAKYSVNKLGRLLTILGLGETSRWEGRRTERYRTGIRRRITDSITDS